MMTGCTEDQERTRDGHSHGHSHSPCHAIYKVLYSVAFVERLKSLQCTRGNRLHERFFLGQPIEHTLAEVQKAQAAMLTGRASGQGKPMRDSGLLWMMQGRILGDARRVDPDQDCPEVETDKSLSGTFDEAKWPLL